MTTATTKRIAEQAVAAARLHGERGYAFTGLPRVRVECAECRRPFERPRAWAAVLLCSACASAIVARERRGAGRPMTALELTRKLLADTGRRITPRQVRWLVSNRFIPEQRPGGYGPPHLAAITFYYDLREMGYSADEAAALYRDPEAFANRLNTMLLGARALMIFREQGGISQPVPRLHPARRREREEPNGL